VVNVGRQNLRQRLYARMNSIEVLGFAGAVLVERTFRPESHTATPPLSSQSRRRKVPNSVFEVKQFQYTLIASIPLDNLVTPSF
jgi:hypothetical protein